MRLGLSARPGGGVQPECGTHNWEPRWRELRTCILSVTQPCPSVARLQRIAGRRAHGERTHGRDASRPDAPAGPSSPAQKAALRRGSSSAPEPSPARRARGMPILSSLHRQTVGRRGPQAPSVQAGPGRAIWQRPSNGATQIREGAVHCKRRVPLRPPQRPRANGASPRHGGRSPSAGPRGTPRPPGSAAQLSLRPFAEVPSAAAFLRLSCGRGVWQVSPSGPVAAGGWHPAGWLLVMGDVLVGALDDGVAQGRARGGGAERRTRAPVGNLVPPREQQQHRRCCAREPGRLISCEQVPLLPNPPPRPQSLVDKLC